MKQENYEKIAGIIKEDLIICNQFVDELKSDGENLTYKAMVMREIKSTLISQANRLADYFEREDKEQATKNMDGWNEKNTEELPISDFTKFNPKQFLKNSGV